MNTDSVKYIPVLAKEGIKHEIGGRGERGKLLVPDSTEANLNALQLIVDIYEYDDPIPCDTAYFDALKELRKDNILFKKDVKDHNLLGQSCFPPSKMRFKYLAGWDPDNLMTGTYKGLPLSHAVIERGTNIKSFNLFLTTSLKHYPQHLGLLFQEDSSGKTAYERATEKHGKDAETINVIKKCIPTDTTIPILHHVIRDAPQFINDFSIRYPSAT